MSFINKNTDTAILRAKLTDRGRDLLSKGELNYRYWVVGDSEVDYNQIYNINDIEDRTPQMILTPKDLTTEIKYPISSQVETDPFNVLNGSQSITKSVFGANVVKGFYDGLNFSDDYVDNDNTKKYFKSYVNFNVNEMDGTDEITATSFIGTPEIGDILMIACLNSSQTSLGNINEIPVEPTPYLYYKIMGISGSTITLDRNLPNLSGGGTTATVGYVIQGGDAINNYYSTFEPTYWDYDNLSYQDNNGNVANDVKVWNFNVVYRDSIIGLNPLTHKDNKYFPSRIYSGVYNIDQTLPQDNKLFGIIHYTNNATTNVYGESFKRGSMKVELKNIMYHKIHTSGSATSMGVTLLSQENPDSNEYDLLKDIMDNVVGRVYFKSKIIIITDEELATALSYRGNRSWTLPRLNGNAVPSIGGGNPFLTSEKTMYITYVLDSTTGGFSKNMPCQKYTIVNNQIDGQDSVMVYFPKNELPFLKPTLSNGGGFTANKIYLLAQLVNKGSKPLPTEWRMIDITSNFTTTGNLTSTLLENGSYTLTESVYSSASLFDLNTHMGFLTDYDDEYFQFGEEAVMMGNIEVIPTATIHKASFVFPMLFNQFRQSTNPTYDSDGGKPIYISEVGVYDENRELVIIGKTSSPILKGYGDTILLQLDLDF